MISVIDDTVRVYSTPTGFFRLLSQSEILDKMIKCRQFKKSWNKIEKLAIKILSFLKYTGIFHRDEPSIGSCVIAVGIVLRDLTFLYFLNRKKSLFARKWPMTTG